MSSEFADLEMKDYAVFILGVIAAMKVPCTRDRRWAEGLKDRIEHVRAMHAHFTAQGSEVPLTLESCPDLQDTLTAYNSLVVLPPVPTIPKIQGNIVICMPPVDPPPNKGATAGVHGAKPGKPTITSPTLQPAWAGSAPRTLQPTPNRELGGARPIDHGSGIQHAPNVTITPCAPSAQSRQLSPLPIGSIAGGERPVKRRAGSPPPNAMLIDDPAPIRTASAMPPLQLQMSVPSCSQAIVANPMNVSYTPPPPRITASLPRCPSDRSLSRQHSARSLHHALSSIEWTGSQGSLGSPQVPTISLDDPPRPQTSGTYFADVLLPNLWQRICSLEDSQHTMHSQLDTVMGVLGGDPALFAAHYGVLATRFGAIPSNHREVIQALFQLEKRVTELEGSDDEFPSKEEEEVVHSVLTGAFDPSTSSRSGGDKGLDFNGED
ncbi:hypothetical protein BKA93DRAFT_826555 [Sparassis latifolia]